MRDAIEVEMYFRPYDDCEDMKQLIGDDGWVQRAAKKTFPNIDAALDGMKRLLVTDGWRDMVKELHVCIHPDGEGCSKDVEGGSEH